MSADWPAGAERLLVFRVGEGRYGVSLGWVHGVRELGSAPPPPPGRPRVDLLQWFGGQGAPRGMRTLLMVGRTCAQAEFTVGAAEGICEVGEIRPWPALIAPQVRRLFRGVAQCAGGAVLVFDPEGLLRTARPEGTGAAGEAG